MRYEPESSVTAPRVPPRMRTCAPGSGRCVCRSVTLPAMVPLLCASAGPANARPTTPARIRRSPPRIYVLLLCGELIGIDEPGQQTPVENNLLMYARSHLLDKNL